MKPGWDAPRANPTGSNLTDGLRYRLEVTVVNQGVTGVMVTEDGTVSSPDGVDAVVIGAGFSGIYMVHWLRQAGFQVAGFEAGSSVGGTWYWNRYPGARCDSESMWYSFSFLPEVEQEWPLTERFPSQPQVLAYLDHVADYLDVRRHFTFNARVTSATYDEAASRWTVRTDTGEEVECRWVITAVGCLSHANLPEIPNAERFAGRILQTSRWPHEPVDLAGLRVGVIGTGATGIQAIPVIAAEAAHLTVFQRTAQYTLPAVNRPIPPDFERMWKDNYVEWRRRGRLTGGGVPYPVAHRSAHDVSDEEREELFEAAWARGALDFALGTFGDLTTDEEANEMAAEFIRAKIREIVKDPEVAEMLIPWEFPFGTKRTPMDTGYYETFNRPNVTLVDIKRTPIVTMTTTGIETTAGHHDLDVLIYATGFDALTGPLVAMDITGRDGLKLAEAWADGPVTYLGLAVPRFPNLFTITGPGSPSVLSNMPVSIEQHVEWIVDLLQWARQAEVEVIEATGSAAAEWTAHVQEVAARTLYPKAASWYMGANVPGKPRLFLPYVGGCHVYRQKCDDVATNGYEGFTMAPLRAGV